MANAAERRKRIRVPIEQKIRHSKYQVLGTPVFEENSAIDLSTNGISFVTVPLPSSVWAWGDPSHTRILPKEAFMFLHQPTYEGVKTSPMSDFRYMYKADFDIIHVKEEGECQQIVMQAVKPSRISS